MAHVHTDGCTRPLSAYIEPILIRTSFLWVEDCVLEWDAAAVCLLLKGYKCTHTHTHTFKGWSPPFGGVGGRTIPKIFAPVNCSGAESWRENFYCVRVGTLFIRAPSPSPNFCKGGFDSPSFGGDYHMGVWG